MGQQKREIARLHKQVRDQRKKREDVSLASVEAYNYWERTAQSAEDLMTAMMSQFRRWLPFYFVLRFLTGGPSYKVLKLQMTKWRIRRIMGGDVQLTGSQIAETLGLKKSMVEEAIRQISQEAVDEKKLIADLLEKGECVYKEVSTTPVSYINAHGARQMARVYNWTQTPSDERPGYVRYPYQSKPCRVSGSELPVVYHYSVTFQNIMRVTADDRVNVEGTLEHVGENGDQ